jgi:hypothetical protein
MVWSFFLLFLLPVAYEIANALVERSWVAVAAGVVVAVGLGTVLARLTAGVTNVIKPLLLPVWVVGVPFLLILSISIPWPLRFWSLVGFIAWPVSAIAFGIAVVRLTQRGHTAIAWSVIAIAAPVVFVLAIPDGFLGFVNGRLPVTDSEREFVILRLAVNPLLHLTLFELVYLRALAVAKSR